MESGASDLPLLPLVGAATAQQVENADIAFALSWPQWLHYFEQSDTSAERKEELLLDLKVG